MIRSSLIALATLLAKPALAADWTFARNAEPLRDQSCTGERIDPDRIDLSVSSVDLGTDPTLPDGVSFAGGWALSSDDPHFGGLSGLSVTDDGSLLTVSDTGRALRFGVPKGEHMGALVWDLRHESGRSLTGKLTGDAEGLALKQGLAFISFERDFRVLAYDFGACGAAARGVSVTKFPARYGKTRLRANAGPESLELTEDGRLRIGIEQPIDDRVLTAMLTREGGVRFDTLEGAATLPEGFRHVGADTLTLADGRVAKARLLRAYERRRGNRIRLDLEVDGETTRIALAPPLTVDNFEGAALTETEDGLRAYIISDDNFSARQRTLLFAFDLRLD